MIKICADRREVGGGRQEASGGGSPEEEVKGVWVQGGTRAGPGGPLRCVGGP